MQIEKVKRQIVSDVRQGINNCNAAEKIFVAYKQKKDEMEELIARSEKAFSWKGITVLDLMDTQKASRDFITKYNQALVQGTLTRELLKVYSGEIR